MQRLRIMISSRCNTKIKDETKSTLLSELRLELKSILIDEKLFGETLFEVWISEEPTDVSARESAWDECMSQVEKADIILCLYSGEGGWAKHSGDIGICHAELETAFNKEPAKLFIINIQESLVVAVNADDPINKKMAAYLTKINRFYNSANSKNEIINISKEIVVEAVLKLAKMGRRESRKGKYNFGEALDWARMNFSERKKAIETEILDQFEQSGHILLENECVAYSHHKAKYLFKVHGIPSGMNVSSAREMVGQPFLRDHILIDNESINGPIHLVGVNKGVTEQQAIGILGHPDAVVVEGAYGVYIADKIQSIQMVFLANCRDSASTRHNVQKFIDWLQESGEVDDFFKRGKSRKAIVDIINKQIKKT